MLVTGLLSISTVKECVAWWCCGWDVGLMIKRLQIPLPAIALSGNNSGQVVHRHIPQSPTSIIWYV